MDWSAEEWGAALIGALIAKEWGIPSGIISDRDTRFLNETCKIARLPPPPTGTPYALAQPLEFSLVANAKRMQSLEQSSPDFQGCMSTCVSQQTRLASRIQH
jgi:hypothetical protein